MELSFISIYTAERRELLACGFLWRDSDLIVRKRRRVHGHLPNKNQTAAAAACRISRDFDLNKARRISLPWRYAVKFQHSYGLEQGYTNTSFTQSRDKWVQFDYWFYLAEAIVSCHRKISARHRRMLCYSLWAACQSNGLCPFNQLSVSLSVRLSLWWIRRERCQPPDPQECQGCQLHEC